MEPGGIRGKFSGPRRHIVLCLHFAGDKRLQRARGVLSVSVKRNEVFKLLENTKLP